MTSTAHKPFALSPATLPKMGSVLRHVKGPSKTVLPVYSRASRSAQRTADDQVALVAASGRKGWLPAYRDAVMFKIAYSYGLRCNETALTDRRLLP